MSQKKIKAVTLNRKKGRQRLVDHPKPKLVESRECEKLEEASREKTNTFTFCPLMTMIDCSLWEFD